MLDISKPLTSNKIQTYFRAEYSLASNAYFTQGGTLQGEWHGQLSSVLGLGGGVTEQAFDRLSEGQHPHTGEQLIQHRDTIKTQNGEELGHRAGWDLTFNAPKTVSLTALVGEDNRVRDAHRAAVRTALDAVEKYVQARMGGNNAAETTGKWIAATFEHDTSRPVDGYPAPHLHTHVIVFNLTEDARGQARSLQPYELFRIQSMATAIYQNNLERQLRRLGYGIERGLNHAPEVKGYSREYLNAESLRNAQIQRELKDHGLSGAEAINNIKHQNREAKLKITSDELKAMHKRNAAAHGDQPAHIVSEAAERNTHVLGPEKTQQRAEVAVTFARNRLSERSSVFEHFEVIRDALRHVQGKVGLPEIEAEVAKQKAEGRFIEARHIRPNAPAWRYTTPELMEVERQTIGCVLAGRNSVQAIAALTDQQLAAQFLSLNEDQRRLVQEVLASTSRVIGVQGNAGTGKTTALKAVAAIAAHGGFRVTGLGPTSRAAKELKDAGIDAETLQAFLSRGDDPNTAPPRLFFVDESSLASSKQIHSFLDRMQPQDRVLLIGDVRQHQSIEAGRIFDELQDAGMPVSRLTKIIRQKDEGLRQVVEAMAARRIEDGVDLLLQQGRVHEIEHRRQRFDQIARTYAEHAEGTVVISPDNRSRQELNAAIRTALRAGNQLQNDAFQLDVLIARQDLTTEDRGVAASFRIGDSVRYLRGSKTLGIESKTYASVEAVNHEQNLLTVQTEAGQLITYDPSRLRGVSVYTTERRSFGQRERVQFTAPWKAKGISNRDMGTVTDIDEHGNVSVRLDGSGRTVKWNLKRNKHLDYAYAMTSHSFQGATVDRVLIHIDTSDTRITALVNEILAYVGTSRPRYDAQIFTDNASRLATALSRTQRNTTALSDGQVRAFTLAL